MIVLSLLYLIFGLHGVASKARTESPAIHPPQRAFMDRAELVFSCPTPGAAVHYTTDGTDPTLQSPAVQLGNSTFSLVISTPGSHTVKAIAVAKDMGPSDIVLKRLAVFQEMPPPRLLPRQDGRYDAPLNLTAADPSVCSVDYLELELCIEVTKNGVAQPAQCFPCGGSLLLEDIGAYALAAYYSVDDLVVSQRGTRKFTLTRPPFDTKPVYINSNAPFQFKPKVDVFAVSKDLDAPRLGCSARNVRGHHIILHNPLGHFDIMPPAGGCGSGLSLPSDSAKDFALSLEETKDSSSFFRNPAYKQLVEKLTKDDISSWKKQYQAAVSEGATSCTITTNAGFFDINNFNCLGNIVSRGKVIQVSRNHNVNFGIRNGSFVIGYLDDDEIEHVSPKGSAGKPGFDTLISGLVWLVRGGRSYVQDSVAPAAGTGKIGDGEDMSIQSNGPNFVNILSARTAIGYDAYGRLMMAQVEGESFVRGMNLLEFADFLMELGFESAINLDGGGSATITAFNTLVTEPSWKCTAADNEAADTLQDDDVAHPAAADTYRMCEKQVSSITCVHPMRPPDDALLLPSQLEEALATPRPSGAPSAKPHASTATPTMQPSSAAVDSNAKADYSDVDVAALEHQLRIYEFCTYSFAIFLVISLTVNGWCAISYNALKQRQREGVLPSKVMASSTVSTAREIELNRRPRTAAAASRYEQQQDEGLNEDDDYDLGDFEANAGEDSDGNDSYDDEAALMSPPSKGGRGRAPAGLNPFQRR